MSKRSRRIAVVVSILIGAVAVLSVVTDAESEPVTPDKPKVQRVSAKQFNQMVRRERRTTCKIALTRRCYKRRATIKPVSKRAWRVQVNRTHRAERRARRFQRRLRNPQFAIRVVFGQYAGQALRVAACESGFSVNAGNGQYQGIFQMGSNERATYGHGATPLEQARAAYRYFAASGFDWSPWECKP